MSELPHEDPLPGFNNKRSPQNARQKTKQHMIPGTDNENPVLFQLHSPGGRSPTSPNQSHNTQSNARKGRRQNKQENKDTDNKCGYSSQLMNQPSQPKQFGQRRNIAPEEATKDTNRAPQKQNVEPKAKQSAFSKKGPQGKSAHQNKPRQARNDTDQSTASNRPHLDKLPHHPKAQIGQPRHPQNIRRGPSNKNELNKSPQEKKINSQKGKSASQIKANDSNNTTIKPPPGFEHMFPSQATNNSSQATTSHRVDASKQKKTQTKLYEDHIDIEQLNEGVESGIYWKSKVRVMGSADKGFVTFDNENRVVKDTLGNEVTLPDADVYLDKKGLNRCFDGDTVYLQALPMTEWKARVLDSEKALLAEVGMKVDSAEPSKGSLQARAKVVGIGARRSKQFAVFLEPNRKPVDNLSKNSIEHLTLLESDKFLRAVSPNPKTPWFLVYLSKDIRQLYDLNTGSVIDKNIFYRLAFLQWEAHNRLPHGKLLSKIGGYDGLDTKVEIIKEEYGLHNQLCDVSPESAEHGDEIVQNDQEMRPSYLLGRSDYRRLADREAGRISFTIDPETARDLDDAITFRMLSTEEVEKKNNSATHDYSFYNGIIPLPTTPLSTRHAHHFGKNAKMPDNPLTGKIPPPPKHVAEITVHVADVTHYMQWNCPTDLEAQQRTTTVYFPHRCYPMLPTGLCNKLCSLHPLEEKLCLSVTFYIDVESGDLLLDGDGYPWHVHRAVLESCARFSYEEAQMIIDGLRGGNLSHVAKNNDTYPADLVNGYVNSTEELVRKGIFSSNNWTHERLWQLLFAIDYMRNELDGVSFQKLNDSIFMAIETGASYDEFCDEAKFPKVSSFMSRAKGLTKVANCDNRWDTLIENGPEFREQVFNSLLAMDMLAQRTRKNRIGQGAGRFDQEKLKFFIDPVTKTPFEPAKESHSSSHELIEEMMLMANRIIGAVNLVDPSIRYRACIRNHAPPNPTKLDVLHSIINQIVEQNMAETGSERALPVNPLIACNAHEAEDVFSRIQKLVLLKSKNEKAAKHAVQALVGQFILCLSFATYNPVASLVPDGHVVGSQCLHWAMNFFSYSHFTSPIRRYADDITHRATSILLSRRGENYWRQSPAQLIGSYEGPHGPHRWSVEGLADESGNLTGDIKMKIQEDTRMMCDRINAVRKDNDDGTRAFDTMLLNSVLERDILQLNNLQRHKVTCVFPLDRSIKVYLDTYGMVLPINFNYHADISHLECDAAITAEILKQDELAFYRETHSESEMFTFDKGILTLKFGKKTKVITPLETQLSVFMIPNNNRQRGISLLIDPNFH